MISKSSSSPAVGKDNENDDVISKYKSHVLHWRVSGINLILTITPPVLFTFLGPVPTRGPCYFGILHELLVLVTRCRTVKWGEEMRWWSGWWARLLMISGRIFFFLYLYVFFSFSSLLPPIYLLISLSPALSLSVFFPCGFKIRVDVVAVAGGPLAAA